MEVSKSNKYDYLKAPVLIENFKQTYLTSLNIFLNDDKYEQKIQTLPKLKSSTITKYEKILEKEAADRNKKKFHNEENDSIELPKAKTLQSNQKASKPLTMRYIIIDHELVEITLKAIEESNECNSKLTDPFNSYFHESNEKIRKKALEQIIANIIPKNSKNLNKGDIPFEDQTPGSKVLYEDLKVLEDKYKEYELKNLQKRETLEGYMKSFKDSCELHNIITLDQKIDYYVYLKKTGFFNKDKHKVPQRGTIRKLKSSHSINTNHNNNNQREKEFRKSHGNDAIKYMNELKAKYKIQDDMLNSSQYETFESEIDTKIKSFQFLKKNFEQSAKFIDKLRMYLRFHEISFDRIILRECDITSDKFYYLITKKYFDFSTLRHLNLSKNNLGDIGGCYLLTLIDIFGVEFNYLNISYNKLGRQSCEILVNILTKNKVNISSLCIGGNQLGDKLFPDLCIGISKNSHLNRLFVNDNDLGKISSVILGTILKYDRKIKLLDVSKNNFGDENIGYMLKGLICNTSLEMLMLNDMGLTNKSLRIFETTLCINSTLKELFLERNKLNFRGWRVLSDILNKNKFIEYISLVGNNFESEHFDMIAEQQRQIKLRVISKSDYFLQISASNDNINFYEYFY